MQYSIKKLNDLENGLVCEVTQDDNSVNTKQVYIVGEPIISGNRRTVNYPLVRLTGFEDGSSWIFDVVFTLSENYYDYEKALIKILQDSFNSIFKSGINNSEPVQGCVSSLDEIADAYKVHGRSLKGQ